MKQKMIVFFIVELSDVHLSFIKIAIKMFSFFLILSSEESASPSAIPVHFYVGMILSFTALIVLIVKIFCDFRKSTDKVGENVAEVTSQTTNANDNKLKAYNSKVQKLIIKQTEKEKTVETTNHIYCAVKDALHPNPHLLSHLSSLIENTSG